MYKEAADSLRAKVPLDSVRWYGFAGNFSVAKLMDGSFRVRCLEKVEACPGAKSLNIIRSLSHVWIWMSLFKKEHVAYRGLFHVLFWVIFSCQNEIFPTYTNDAPPRLAAEANDFGSKKEDRGRRKTLADAALS